MSPEVITRTWRMMLIISLFTCKTNSEKKKKKISETITAPERKLLRVVSPLKKVPRNHHKRAPSLSLSDDAHFVTPRLPHTLLGTSPFASETSQTMKKKDRERKNEKGRKKEVRTLPCLSEVGLHSSLMGSPRSLFLAQKTLNWEVIVHNAAAT